MCGKTEKPNQKTRQVFVGEVPVGGGAPCAVQSICNYALNDVAANVEQIKRLREAGCEIIRIAIPSKKILIFRIYLRAIAPSYRQIFILVQKLP